MEGNTVSTPPNDAWDDQHIENMVGNLLRVGVSIAAIVMIAGGALYLWQNAATPADARVFHGEPSDLCTISGILKSSATLDPRGLMQLGVLLLVATPIARVILSVYAFERQHDRLYVVITLIVLAILISSLMTETGHR